MYIVGLRVTLDLGVNLMVCCLIDSWFHCFITECYLLRAKDILYTSSFSSHKVDFAF